MSSLSVVVNMASNHFGNPPPVRSAPNDLPKSHVPARLASDAMGMRRPSTPSGTTSGSIYIGPHQSVGSVGARRPSTPSGTISGSVYMGPRQSVGSMGERSLRSPSGSFSMDVSNPNASFSRSPSSANASFSRSPSSANASFSRSPSSAYSSFSRSSSMGPHQASDALSPRSPSSATTSLTRSPLLAKKSVDIMISQVPPSPTSGNSIVSQTWAWSPSERDFGSETESQPSNLKPALGVSMMHLRRSLLGYGQVYRTPFGDRQLLYADYTASGRMLRPIEEYIQHHVGPYYGNTHTTSSRTGLQSTRYREEARRIIAKGLNARIDDHGPSGDAIIFAGAGATGCVNKLVGLLRLREELAAGKRCVVLHGPHEHHSNILPWREVKGLRVEMIPEDSKGTVDLGALEAKLVQYQDYDLKVGTFAAASNITGVLAPQEAIAELLHLHGALSLWDFAAAAPHVDVDMNSPGGLMCSKDALFFSTHKMVGGPGTPGILVVKRKLLNATTVPTQPGGGTVSFVTKRIHKYTSHGEEREEAGTPEILGCIRAGCVFHIRGEIGIETMETLDALQVQKLRALARLNNVVLLGPPLAVARRLPIFTFLVSAPWDERRYLHHSFIGCVLNDLYGIQVRGGCMCAGPYGIRLLGVDRTTEELFLEELSGNNGILKPGFVRLSLPFCASDGEIEYAIEAIRNIANDGWALLPQYTLTRDGEWQHVSRRDPFEDCGSIAQLCWPPVDLPPPQPVPTPQEYRHHLKGQLEAGRAILTKAVQDCGLATTTAVPREIVDHPLRWFALPEEAIQFARGNIPEPGLPVLHPRTYSAGKAERVIH